MGKFHRRSHNIVPTGIAAFVWSDGGHDPQAWENVAKNVGVKHRCSTVTEYYVKTWHPRLYYPFELKYCPRGPHTYDACLNYGILDPILSVPNPYNFPSFCQKLPNIHPGSGIHWKLFFFCLVQQASQCSRQPRASCYCSNAWPVALRGLLLGIPKIRPIKEEISRVIWEQISRILGQAIGKPIHGRFRKPLKSNGLLW